MSQYNIVVSTNESTVVAEYVSVYDHTGAYQGEAKQIGRASCRERVYI